jgi:lipopolysaccharide export system protein LptA
MIRLESVACIGCALAAGLIPLAARADRADRQQPTLIVADHQTVDDLKQVSVFTGHVVLTKGTIRVTGERMEYREDAEGYQYAVVTVPSDSLATFHQHRDVTHPGVEETIDGVGERIEYDNRTDTVKLFTRAVVRRLENGVIHDEFSADRIVYDARNSHYDLANSDSKPGSRVVARIAPRNVESPPVKDAAPKTEGGPKPEEVPKPEAAPKPPDPGRGGLQ